MIYPRRTAIEAATTVESALSGVVGRIAPSGDLRMERSTLERIEFVVECPDRETVIKAMSGAGWRKLRSGRGPMVFARDGFPKTVICVAHVSRFDLLGVHKPGNFEVLLFLRTGTTIFKASIMRHLRNSGLTMRPEQGLYNGDTLVAWSEEDIFIAAGLDFIPPTERYSFDETRHPAAVSF